MGKKRAERSQPVTLGDLLMNATVNEQEVEVKAIDLLLGAAADTFNANVTATEGELGWDTESKRIEKIERKAREAKQRGTANELRFKRREAMGLNPDGTLPEPKPEEMSATEREKSGRAALEEYRANRKVRTPSRKTVVTAVEDTNPRTKMTKLEFDGKMDLHRKLYEKTPSGKWVINCAAARTYRHQVWEYNSKQRDEAGELIRTEHPDVKAVQLAA